MPVPRPGAGTGLRPRVASGRPGARDRVLSGSPCGQGAAGTDRSAGRASGRTLQAVAQQKSTVLLSVPLGTRPCLSPCLLQLVTPPGETVMDTEAWRAAVHGVAKSRTRLSDGTTARGPHTRAGQARPRAPAPGAAGPRGPGVPLARRQAPPSPGSLRDPRGPALLLLVWLVAFRPLRLDTLMDKCVWGP
ncbi:unnamed protein product [Rangifer tarandus platyrhynchus]|uniref:Uncharacterized protein n=2 Tax=Rangifer tarandus platyrhynchus TaxID=3082113 RepID=A0ABN8YHC1_RANTA|nr:unnamed protein product [Rangifer tarandus platyrhynchus]